MFKPISDSPDCLDTIIAIGLFQLFPDFTDMIADCFINVNSRGLIPHLIVNLFFCKNPPHIAGQKIQKRKLARSQGQFLAVDLYLTFMRIEGQICEG